MQHNCKNANTTSMKNKGCMLRGLATYQNNVSCSNGKAKAEPPRLETEYGGNMHWVGNQELG